MIASILAQPESKTLEFKRDLSSSKPLLKTLVAFANSAGGQLVIGVADGKQVVGVEDPLGEEERLCNLIADSITPRLVPNIELVTAAEKTLLIAEVYPSNSRPHYLTKEGPETGVYVRLGSTNRQADSELIAGLRRSVEGVAFDEMPMTALSVADLDLKAAQELFGDGRRLDHESMAILRMLRKEQGRIVPTKGAILLFGKDRTAYFPDAWVQCGRFIGTDKSDIFDHIDIIAPLPKTVDEIMLFLKKHAMRGADFSEVRRKDAWSIPLTILRELVINALVHADYSQRGSPVRIAFFDDRIEIENPGILLPGMTIDDMKQGASQIRNPVIVRVFRELNMMEQWGSGIPSVFREAERLGLPPLEIQEVAMRLRFVVPLLEPIPLKTRSGAAVHQKTVPAGARSGAQSGAQSDKILRLLSKQPFSANELSSHLGLESKTGSFKRSIKDLLDSKSIEYTLPEKPQSRLQKYRLTEKGRRMTFKG